MSPAERIELPVTIRPERDEDLASIHDLLILAFRGEGEAKLVDELRRSPDFIPELSLVAVDGEQIVGHILFSRIAIVSGGEEAPALALAPMAVRPGFQCRGIGSTLVEQGIEECRRLGHGIVVVLGHPEYYPRFGFTPARPKGIIPPYDVGDHYFMVCELHPGALDGIAGMVRYPAAFDEV